MAKYYHNKGKINHVSAIKEVEQPVNTNTQKWTESSILLLNIWNTISLFDVLPMSKIFSKFVNRTSLIEISFQKHYLCEQNTLKKIFDR